jgi:type IV secretory pathway VirB4 component
MARKNRNETTVIANSAIQAMLTPVGLEFNRNTLILGENLCRIYGIIHYPNELDYGWYARLTNIPGTIVSIGYTPINNGDFINTLSRTINLNRTYADGTKDQVEKMRKKKTAEDAERIITSIDQNNESAGSFCTTIMVLSRDDDDFEDKCSRVENAVNVMGCKIRILANLQKEAYQHLSPSHAFSKEISDITNRPFLISAFTGGFPFANSGFCDRSGFYLAKNSEGGIIVFNPWERSADRTNSNITIIGDPGTGKSTALKHIVKSEYARGTKIILFDIEGEFRELCINDNINGNWVDVAGGRGGLINPLQVRPAPRDVDEFDDEAEYKEESAIADLAIHLKTLETFFNLYIPSLSDKHRGILNKKLIELYNKFNITWETDVTKLSNEQFPIMSDLYELIKDSEKNEAAHKDVYSDLVLYLESAANGADKGLWNGHTTISADNNFICLDMKSITLMGGSVLSAQYFNVLSWVWEQITKDRKERVMCVADECWALIDPKTPQSLEFLRNAEKRARKYEGSIVVATQNIIDFLDPSVKKYGQPILDMPSIKLFFGMDGNSLRETRETFALNEAQFELIASKQRGIALMKVGSRAVKVKFEFTDKQLASFGTGGGR